MKPILTYTLDFKDDKPVRRARVLICSFIHIRETVRENVLAVFYAPGCSDYIEGNIDTLVKLLGDE